MKKFFIILCAVTVVSLPILAYAFMGGSGNYTYPSSSNDNLAIDNVAAVTLDEQDYDEAVDISGHKIPAGQLPGSAFQLKSLSDGDTGNTLLKQYYYKDNILVKIFDRTTNKSMLFDEGRVDKVVLNDVDSAAGQQQNLDTVYEYDKYGKVLNTWTQTGMGENDDGEVTMCMNFTTHDQYGRREVAYAKTGYGGNDSGKSRQYFYDDWGRLTEQQRREYDADTDSFVWKRTRYQYDGMQITAATEYNRESGKAESSTLFDDIGRAVEVKAFTQDRDTGQEEQHTSVVYSYDNMNRQSAVQYGTPNDAGEQKITGKMEFDSHGRLYRSWTVDPDNGSLDLGRQEYYVGVMHIGSYDDSSAQFTKKNEFGMVDTVTWAYQNGNNAAETYKTDVWSKYQEYNAGN